MSHELHQSNDNVNNNVTVADASYSGLHNQLHAILKEGNGAAPEKSGIHNGGHHSGGHPHLHHLELHSPKAVEQYYKKHPVGPGMPAPID